MTLWQLLLIGVAAALLVWAIHTATTSPGSD